MKRIAFSCLAAAVCIGFSGCKSMPKMDSDKTSFDVLQEQAAEITKDGGLAAVGVGESKNTQIAITKAKANARIALAQQVQIKVDALQKSFVEEIGEAESSEINTLFSQAAKLVTAQSLQGTMPAVQKYDINGEMTSAYVLMVLNPAIVPETLKNNTAKHLYERFRASKAFEELHKEIKAFEEKEQQGMVQ